MIGAIPIITKVEFFNTSFYPSIAHVTARNFSSLTYRKSGRISVASADASFMSEAGTLTLVPRGCDYSTEIFERGEMIVLHYTVAGDVDFFEVPTLIEPTHEDVFLSLFSRALKHSLAGNECACMADAYRLFAEIEREFAQKKAQPSPAMVMVKQYIDENIADPELRVSELAELHKTSEVYFRREFKRYYSESPVEYIKRRRIQLACNLLCTNLYSVTDVATRSGFDNISYFSSEFKKIMGVSPREYRNM